MIDNSYEAVMSRKNEIMKKSVGVDYQKYEIHGIAFDYEKMLSDSGYPIKKIGKYSLRQE